MLARTGAPVGWAAYSGHVALARMLVSHGADAAATDLVLWRGLPPLLCAATAGRAEALKWLCEEEVQSIHTTDGPGLGILHHITSASEKWEELPGHVECHEYAIARGAKKQFIRNVP